MDINVNNYKLIKVADGKRWIIVNTLNSNLTNY